MFSLSEVNVLVIRVSAGASRLEECNPCKLNCEEISYYRYWLTKIRQSAPAFREPIDDELTGGKFVPSFSASLSLSLVPPCQSVQLRRRQQHRRSSSLRMYARIAAY